MNNRKKKNILLQKIGIQIKNTKGMFGEQSIISIKASNLGLGVLKPKQD